MPQIGWFELLIIVVISIIVIGPKDFPIVLRKSQASQSSIIGLCFHILVVRLGVFLKIYINGSPIKIYRGTKTPTALQKW